MTTETQTEIEDLEVHAKAGTAPKKGKKYRYKVDRKHFVSKDECKSVSQILTIAGLDPNCYELRQIFRPHRVESLDISEVVCFTNPGVERFVTIVKDAKEG